MKVAKLVLKTSFFATTWAGGGGVADIQAATRIEARKAMRISFAWRCVPREFLTGKSVL
jgi:hypothetical protein